MRAVDWIEGLSGRAKLPPTVLRTPETVGLLIQNGMGAIREDVRRAGVLSKSAEKLAQCLNEPVLAGQAHRLAGHVFLLSDRPKDAILKYQEALIQFESDAVERASTAVAMIQALGYVGRYDDAARIAGGAITTFEDIGDFFRAARVRANFGNMLHRQDRFEEAVVQFEIAYPILVENGAEADAAIVAHNFAVCLMAQLEFDRAQELFQKAFEFFSATEQLLLAYEVELNQAYLLGRKGDLFQSLTLYRSLLARRPSNAGLKVGHCLLDQSDFMLNAGLFSDAIQAARDARDVFESVGARLEIGKSYLIESIASLKRGQVQVARELLLAARKRLGKERSLNWLALAELNASEILMRLGKISKARLHISQALALEPSAERVPLIRRTAIQLALEAGDYGEANELLKVDQSPDLKAAFYRTIQLPDPAQQYARQALSEYDGARSLLGSHGLRRAHAVANESALRECFRTLSSPGERLGVVARLKDQGLGEMIRTSRNGQQFSDQFAGTGEVEAVRTYRESLTLTYAPLDQEQTISAMKEGHVFIEFFVDSGTLFAFSISSSGIQEHRLCELSELRNSIHFFHLNRLRRSVSGERLVEKALRRIMDFIESAFGEDKRVVTVGRDGPILTIPFHALPYGSGSMIDKVEISYAPSFSAWRSMQSRDRHQGQGSVVLGFADENAPQIALEVEIVSQIAGVTPVRKFQAMNSAVAGAHHIHIAAHGIVREDLPLFSAMQLGEDRFTVLDVLQMEMQADLVVLSGCSTGVSILGEAFESQGFIEAMFASGCRSVVASLWDAADEPALEWMSNFYQGLETLTPLASYSKACRMTRERWPHPGDWATFAFAGLDCEKDVLIFDQGVHEK
jgi:tetratricopeptide (TPR) repeat protein